MGPPDDTPVLILTGPPGAGKTTTARILADRHERAVHVESDHFFHFIRSGLTLPLLEGLRSVPWKAMAASIALVSWLG